MIFVMLGTQNNSFHRLLEKVDNLIEKKVIQEEVIVQAGYTKYQSKNLKQFSLISKSEMGKYQEQASLIITHGGGASIVSSLKLGKKVIAVPRKHCYAEHVNDHQQDIVQTFAHKGYIIGVDDVEQLEDALIKAKDFEPQKYISNNKKILDIIEKYIETV